MFGFKKSHKKTIDRASLRAARKQRRARQTQSMVAQEMRVPRRAGRSMRRRSTLLERISTLWGFDVAVDLGTSNTLVYVPKRGLVFNAPSVVARYVATGHVLAVGEEAKRMEGRTPDDIEVVRPIRQGVIADYDMALHLLRFALQSAMRRTRLGRPRLLIGVPSGVTSIEKRAVLEASLEAGARKTVLIEEPLAAAIGAGLRKAASPVALVVDIGGGTTNIAVIGATGVVVSASLRIGGDDFDNAIVKYCRRRRGLHIGTYTAEGLKKAIGTVDRQGPVLEAVVSGRDLVTGLPKAIQVDSRHMQQALEAPARTLIDAIKSTLEKTPPEMIADIVDHGIILTGGGALIQGFDRLLTRATGIAAYRCDHPLYAVVLGAGRALSEMTLLQDGLVDL